MIMIISSAVLLRKTSEFHMKDTDKTLYLYGCL